MYQITRCHVQMVSRDSVRGTEARQRVGWSGLRNPTEARGFSLPQTPLTSSGAHGYWWLFPGVRRLGLRLKMNVGIFMEAPPPCVYYYKKPQFLV